MPNNTNILTHNHPKTPQKQPRLLFLGIVISLLNLFWSCASHAQAQDDAFQSNESLYQLVQNYLKQKTDQHLHNARFDVQTLSRHIHFKACKTQPELQDKNPTNVTGRQTFNVSCAEPEWSIYMTATIEGDLPVVISTQGILKQAVIKDSDVRLALIPYQKVRRGSLTKLENVIGNRAKRAIAPNKIVSIRDVEPPYWVFKDRPVVLVSEVGEIRIETKGIALDNAVEQSQVSVRNLSSQKTLKGIVVAPNTVWIP